MIVLASSAALLAAFVDVVHHVPDQEEAPAAGALPAGELAFSQPIGWSGVWSRPRRR
jgi:hypothetical protein